jgi:hypothetical protein
MALTDRQAWRRVLAVAALAASLAVAGVLAGGAARAAGGPCGEGYCVVLIEVNGLTPHDVTPQTTPFMWALAHPDEPSGPNGSGLGIPNALLGQRAGWIWQAPRGVMSASNGAATASLLTGAQPEHSGVPADEFLDGSTWKALGGNANASGGTPDQPQPITSTNQTTLLGMVQQNATGNEQLARAYVGDPALFDLVTDGADKCSSPTDPQTVGGWRPGNPSESVNCKDVTVDSNSSDPALCTPPSNPSAAATTPCPADDASTMNAATNDLTSNTGSKLQLTYAYLAELGIVKQHSGDVQAALSDTDQAIAEYVTSYATGAADVKSKWDHTVLMIVGNHGYEPTPQILRVPDPRDSTQTTSLAKYIEDIGGNSVTVVPQGTSALVYYTGDPADTTKRDTVLKNIRAQVTQINDGVPECKPVDTSGTTGQCIDDVLYTSPNAQDGDTANTVQAKHPTWHLGTGPAAVVLMGRGWAAAAVTPAVDKQNLQDNPNTTTPTNPYPASDGGPRNRAVAALVDGPGTLVKQINGPNPNGTWDGRDPVSSGPATGDANSQTPLYQTAPANQEVTPAVDQANASPEDDADKQGHEQQPLTVDFMPTIAALMRVSTSANQLDGSIIQVPWKTQLSAVSDFEDIGAGTPEPVPELPPPPVIVPPAPKGYDFHGLIRNLRARVGTVAGGRFIAARQAKRGTRLDYIDLSADFGKPLTAVTLTLYRPAKNRSRASGARSQLVTIAHFMPFTVQRAPGVELRFKVPKQFKPTAIGVLVQEAVLSPPKPAAPGGKPQPNFHGIGPTGGGIVTVQDAALLHGRAGVRSNRHGRRSRKHR